MSDEPRRFEWTRHQAPLDADLIAELLALWEGVFECSFQEAESILRGDEVGENTNVVYVAREGQRLAGTCHLTISGTDSRLGGVGEVAVSAEFRRLGLATKLCQKAQDEFFARGGEALFLGTVNPTAKRIYRRLGWRHLPGANVLVREWTQPPSDEFLADWFSPQSQSSSVRLATADIRVPLIPLALAANYASVLDANVGLYSTRYVLQNSCMGLYPRYQQVMKSGAVFGAWTDDQKLVGLSTVHIKDDASVQIDAFAQTDVYSPTDEVACWNGLIQRATEWAAEHTTEPTFAVVSVTDGGKLQVFTSYGFQPAGRGPRLALDDRQATVTYRLELKQPNR